MHNAAMQIASQCPDNCCLPLLFKGKGFLSLEGGREDINHVPEPRAGWEESPFPFPFGQGPEGIITTCVGRTRSSPALPRSGDSSLSLCLCQTSRSPSPQGALRDLQPPLCKALQGWSVSGVRTSWFGSSKASGLGDIGLNSKMFLIPLFFLKVLQGKQPIPVVTKSI